MSKASEYRLRQLQQAAALEMDACSVKKQFTPEKIREWKELGLTQPEWISDTDWKMEDTLNPRQMIICKSAALLMSNEEIAEISGMSPGYVSQVVNSQVGKKEISTIQDKFFTNLQKMIEDITPIAIKTAFTLMLDEKTKPQTRVDAAFRFMDRFMGRPSQKIEVETNLIRQVFEKLDSQNIIDIASKRIENLVPVTEAQALTEIKEELDPVDSWVRENLT